MASVSSRRFLAAAAVTMAVIAIVALVPGGAPTGAAESTTRVNDQATTVGATADVVLAEPTVDLDAGTGLLAPTSQATSRVAVRSTSRLTVRVKFARKAVPRATVRVLAEGKLVGAPQASRTGRRGRVVVDVPADTRVVISVSEDDQAASIESTIVTAPPGGFKTVVVDLGRVPSAHSLTLAVHSLPSGRPLTGAKVIAHTQVVKGQTERLDSGRTNERGSVTLAWQPGATYAVRAADHTTAVATGPTELDGEAMRVELLAHARLFGKLDMSVEIPRGTPKRLRSIQLGLPVRNPQAASPGVVVYLYAGSASIETDGRWQIDGIEFSNEQQVRTGLAVYARFRPGSWRLVTSGLTLRAGDLRGIHDSFANAPSLDLRLRHADGEPWTGGFAVMLAPADALEYEPWIEGGIDSSGRLQLAQLPLGRWSIYRAGFTSSDPGEPLIDFEHGAREAQELITPDLVPLRGTVLDVDGRAVAHAVVHLEIGDRVRAADCDAEGVFDLSAVRRGGEFVLRVHRGWVTDFKAIQAPVTPVEFELENGGMSWEIMKPLINPPHVVRIVATGAPVTIRL